MKIEVISSIENLEGIKDDWLRLQWQDPDVTYYSTYNFVYNWWLEFSKDDNKQLYIICVYQGNSIVGIAPFVIKTIKKSLFKLKVLEFMGKGDHFGVLLDRTMNNESTILKNIFLQIDNDSLKFDRIVLSQIKSNSVLSNYMLRKEDYNKNLNYLTECPQVKVSEFTSLEDYLKNNGPKKIKTYSNKLMRDHSYRFEVVRDESIFSTISQIHIREQRFLNNEKEDKTRKSIFESRDRNYIERLFKNSNDTITFMLRTKDGEVIAYNTCYFFNKTLHSWNIANNPDYYKYSPSKVLYYEIIKYIFDKKNIDVFDFGAGRYSWKFEWTNNFILNYRLDSWNVSTKNGNLFEKMYRLKNILTKK